MIAVWMLHSALVGAMFAFAGLAVEFGTRILRRPARFVWLAALGATVLLSFGRLIVALDATAHGSGGASEAAIAVAAERAPSSVGGASESSTTSPSARALVLPHWLNGFDWPLAAIWLAGSALWGAILIASAIRLRRLRSVWRTTRMEGAAVHVSHDTGPALFGIFRHSIVVPEWVLSLEPKKQRLVVAHEQEHARAGDPVTLFAGALLVLLQPWNPALWVMFRRLRFAVEADCDARVLSRTNDVRLYGELLVDVGEQALAGAAPAAALAEPRSHLERRIMLMTQLPLPRSAVRVAVGLSVGAVFGIVACQVPQPVVAASPAPAVSAVPAARVMSDRAAPSADRVLVHLTSLGLHNVGSTPTILVYASGPARVGIAGQPPEELTDTLRLHSLPAMTVDVTDADVHLRLAGPGTIHVGGDVTGGPAARSSATAPHIVLLKGGVGIVPRLE